VRAGGVKAVGILIRTSEEIAKIRESAQIVGRCLRMIASEVQPGVSTMHLDRLAERFIRDSGGEPAFKGYRDFPPASAPRSTRKWCTGSRARSGSSGRGT
jgi:hypothetical protein